VKDHCDQNTAEDQHSLGHEKHPGDVEDPAVALDTASVRDGHFQQRRKENARGVSRAKVSKGKPAGAFVDLGSVVT
jgi:hypothetical protein